MYTSNAPDSVSIIEVGIVVKRGSSIQKSVVAEKVEAPVMTRLPDPDFWRLDERKAAEGTEVVDGPLGALPPPPQPLLLDIDSILLPRAANRGLFAAKLVEELSAGTKSPSTTKILFAVLVLKAPPRTLRLNVAAAILVPILVVRCCLWE